MHMPLCALEVARSVLFGCGRVDGLLVVRFVCMASHDVHHSASNATTQVLLVLVLLLGASGLLG